MLERRRRIDRALFAAVREAYVRGVPAHAVFPYVFPDAASCKARVNHRIASQAVVIALRGRLPAEGRGGSPRAGTARSRG